MIKWKEKISFRESKKLILMMARHGNHYGGNFSSDADIKRFFSSSGYDFSKVVDECRSHNNLVPLFENLIGSTFYVGSNGGSSKASVIDSNGNEKAIIHGNGILISSVYQEQFERAYSDILDSIGKGQNKLISGISSGINSIESYINSQVEIWNDNNKNNQLLDNKSNKISLEDKITQWIPIISNGGKVITDDRIWQDYKYLKNNRDNVEVHSKMSSYGLSEKDMVDLVTKFKFGVAGLLIELHLLFRQKIPAKIIRAYHWPEINID